MYRSVSAMSEVMSYIDITFDFLLWRPRMHKYLFPCANVDYIDIYGAFKVVLWWSGEKRWQPVSAGVKTGHYRRVDKGLDNEHRPTFFLLYSEFTVLLPHFNWLSCDQR